MADNCGKWDVFISYKNDGEGRNFAARIRDDLVSRGYTAYYSPHERHAGSFPERLRKAVGSCEDFLLIMTQPCLDQLMAHDEVDWVREELLDAYRQGKNIIPLLMPGVSMPKNKKDMPEDLRFLPDKQAILMTETYDRAPLDFLLKWMHSRPEGQDAMRDVFNCSKVRYAYRDVAELGERANTDRAAMYQLANYYYYGLVGQGDGCCRDYERAYELLSTLATGDDVYADYAKPLLAEMYYNGVVPRQSQSFSKAFQLYEQAKDKSGFSAREYAYMKSRGCGCEFDYKEIEESSLKAIEQGDDMAVVGLAKIYMDYGQYRKAAELYKRTAHLLPDAEYQLGMLYRNGLLEDPPKPDFFKAAFYFQHAIESGQCDADVYHQLGRLYFTPTGDFPKDFQLAEKYFLLAAERGSKDARYKLGLIYEYGLTQRDVKKAVHHHKAAAEAGNAFAAYHLALLYTEPEVCNYQKAAEYACIAAKKGIMEGEYLFGMYLFYGRGCEADENRAYKYFAKALEHGMPQAKLMMDRISPNRNV